MVLKIHLVGFLHFTKMLVKQKSKGLQLSLMPNLSLFVALREFYLYMFICQVGICTKFQLWKGQLLWKLVKRSWVNGIRFPPINVTYFTTDFADMLQICGKDKMWEIFYAIFVYQWSVCFCLFFITFFSFKGIGLIETYKATQLGFSDGQNTFSPMHAAGCHGIKDFHIVYNLNRTIFSNTKNIREPLPVWLLKIKPSKELLKALCLKTVCLFSQSGNGSSTLTWTHSRSSIGTRR